MNRFWRNISLVVALLAVSSCSIFGDKEDEELEPKELVKIESKLKVKRLWSHKIGGDSAFLLTGLRPVGDGSRIYAASQDGNVAAFDPESGKEQWKIKLELELASGPAVGEGSLAVSTKDGFVILLDASSGAEQWRAFVGGETLANAIIHDDSVVVQTIDNRLVSLTRFDGKQRWELEQTLPVLTLRGASSPIMVGSSIICGFDNGRILAVDIETGDIEWDSMLAVSTGRSDLDRLADIDGLIAVVGQDIYAAGYNGRVGSLAAESGQLLWSIEISSYVGIAADWNSVYTSRDDGEVIALGRTNGVESWRNDDLLRRLPTVPVPFYTTVVVGDFEGYLHFLSNIDGQMLARVRQGSDAITSAPVVVGNRLFVQSDNGSVAAYEVVQDRPKRSAPDVSSDADES